MSGRWSAALLLLLTVASPARAQTLPGEVPLADVLAVLVVDRDVLAIDAAGGGQTSERLRLGEAVLWKQARGKVGVVITDQRVLAVATRSAAWQDLDIQREEQPPASALLGERVAVATTSRRVIGFDGGSGNLVEYSLGPRERVLAMGAGGNVAVVVTDRQALGLSPFAGGFFRTPIDAAEAVESLSADSNVATLTTARRLLIFRATSGSWEERRRTLR